MIQILRVQMFTPYGANEFEDLSKMLKAVFQCMIVYVALVLDFRVASCEGEAKDKGACLRTIWPH